MPKFPKNTSAFRMSYKKSSFPFKSSPAKDDPHTTTDEHAAHEVEGLEVGTLNDAGTRVIDEKGKWAGVGDRSDLVTPNQLKAHKEKMSKIKVPKM